MQLKRVVVTGLGVLSPIGNNIPEFWDSLKTGKSGAADITHFDAAPFKTRFACEVKNFEVLDFLDRKEARKLDPFVHYALIAVAEAWKDAGFDEYEVDSDRTGVIWASGIGGLNTFHNEMEEYFKTYIPRFNPFFIPKMIADIASGHISIKYNLQKNK